MLSAGDHILEVNVGGIEHVEQREILTLALVEAVYLIDRLTVGVLHEFDPTIQATIEDLDRCERRLLTSIAYPGEQLLEVEVDGETSWLVDKPHPCARLHLDDGPTPSVRITPVPFNDTDRSYGAPRRERRHEVAP